MKVFIYMKSGNVVKTDGVKSINPKNRGDSIVALELKYLRITKVFPSVFTILPIHTIALDQIEAITIK